VRLGHSLRVPLPLSGTRVRWLRSVSGIDDRELVGTELTFTEMMVNGFISILKTLAKHKVFFVSSRPYDFAGLYVLGFLNITHQHKHEVRVIKITYQLTEYSTLIFNLRANNDNYNV